MILLETSAAPTYRSLLVVGRAYNKVERFAEGEPRFSKGASFWVDSAELPAEVGRSLALCLEQLPGPAAQSRAARQPQAR